MLVALRSLQDKVTRLEAERSAALREAAALQERVDEIEANQQQWRIEEAETLRLRWQLAESQTSTTRAETSGATKAVDQLANEQRALGGELMRLKQQWTDVEVRAMVMCVMVHCGRADPVWLRMAMVLANAQ